MLTMRFLGVGNSHAQALGSSACVVERAGEPMLLVDCGHDTLAGYADCYGARLPRAIFITHTHLDHISGLEALFYKAMFDATLCGRVRVYVPVKIVEHLHQRLGQYPDALAEGGANFWDGFQLIPVSERFCHQGFEFRVFPVRHHEYLSAYGLALPGSFLFTGDTRPIPEVLAHFANQGEIIFHDCCVDGNPSHTGVDELAEHYTSDQLARMVLYHFESPQARALIAERGYRVAERYGSVTLGPLRHSQSSSQSSSVSGRAGDGERA